MKRALPTLLAISLPLLAACGPSPERGEVVGRDYSPAWCQVILINNSQFPVCYPDVWTLELKDGEVVGSREVDQTAYDQCEEGEFYPDCAS